MTLKEVAQWLSLKSKEEKIKFIELFLSEITVMNRSFWSDPDLSDNSKLESLKWSNELVHRIWNLLFELKMESRDNFEDSLKENIVFYIKQSV